MAAGGIFSGGFPGDCMRMKNYLRQHPWLSFNIFTDTQPIACCPQTHGSMPHPLLRDNGICIQRARADFLMIQWAFVLVCKQCSRPISDIHQSTGALWASASLIPSSQPANGPRDAKILGQGAADSRVCLVPPPPCDENCRWQATKPKLLLLLLLLLHAVISDTASATACIPVQPAHIPRPISHLSQGRNWIVASKRQQLVLMKHS